MEEAPIQKLTRTQFWCCLAVLVATFMFAEGPLWQHPWRMDSVDAAIFLSYLPVPLLVLGCLAWSKRLTTTAFLLSTVQLTLTKYATTFGIALVLWGISAPEPEPKLAAVRSSAPSTATSKTSTATRERFTLRGRVEDRAGHPERDAVVFVEAGLEGFDFAEPTEPTRIDNDGGTLLPTIAVAQTGQRLSLRSSDGHLHTFLATSDGGAVLFHVPGLASGTPTEAGVFEPQFAQIRCTLHGARELPARLIVLAHPFYTRVRDGAFALEVPAGHLRIAARTAAGAYAATNTQATTDEIVLRVSDPEG